MLNNQVGASLVALLSQREGCDVATITEAAAYAAMSTLAENSKENASRVTATEASMLAALSTTAVGDIDAVTSIFTTKASSSALGSALDFSARSTPSALTSVSLDEMYFLMSFLSRERKFYDRSAQWKTVMKKLDQLNLAAQLVERVEADIEWVERHYAAQREVYTKSSNASSSYAAALSMPTVLESTAAFHSSINSAGLNKELTFSAADDLRLLGVVLSCDLLFLYTYHALNAGAFSSAVKNHTASQQVLSSIVRDSGPLHVSNLADQRLLNRVCALVMRSSDVMEKEYSIRRCGLSLTGVAVMVLATTPLIKLGASLLCERQGEAGSTALRRRESSSGMLSTESLMAQLSSLPALMPSPPTVEAQAHLHCPSHFLLMAVAPFVLQQESKSSVQQQQHPDSPLTSVLIANILSQSTALRACGAMEHIYLRSFGDPYQIHIKLREEVVGTSLLRFLDITCSSFWKSCTPFALTSLCFALVDVQSVAWPSAVVGELYDVIAADELTVETADGTKTHHRVWSQLACWCAVVASTARDVSTSKTCDLLETISTGTVAGSSRHKAIPIAQELRDVTVASISSMVDGGRVVSGGASKAEGMSSQLNDTVSMLVKGSSVWGSVVPSEDCAAAFLSLVDTLLVIGQSDRLALQRFDALLGFDITIFASDVVAITFQRIMTCGSLSPLFQSILRIASHHFNQLQNPHHIFGMILCDEVLKRAASSFYTAESIAPLMIQMRLLLQGFSADVVQANCGAIVHSLSMFANDHLPLHIGNTVSSIWVSMLHDTMLVAPVQFSQCLRSDKDAVLAVRLLNEVALSFANALFCFQSGIQFFGATPLATSMAEALAIMLEISSAGHADAVVQQELVWGNTTHSLLFVLLSMVFDAKDVRVVEGCCSLLVEGLERSAQCSRRRRSSTSMPDVAVPFTTLRRSISEKVRNVFCSRVYEGIVKEVDTAVSLCRLIAMKTILAYDPMLFNFLFSPEVLPKQKLTNILPSDEKPKDGGGTKKPLTERPVLVKDSVLNKVFKDTVLSDDLGKKATTSSSSSPPASLLPAARDRAECLDILRRQNCLSLSVVQLAEKTRALTGKKSPSPNDAAFLSAVLVYITQLTATEVAKGTAQGVAQSSAHGGRTPSLTPSTPSRNAARPTVCTYVGNNAITLDEVIDRAMETIASLSSELETQVRLLQQTLSSFAYQNVTVGVHVTNSRLCTAYGPTFYFRPLVAEAAAFCTQANLVASLQDALAQLLSAVEGLVLTVFKDRDVGFVERTIRGLELTMKLAASSFNICPLSNTTTLFDYFSERLLRSSLRCAVSFATAIHFCCVTFQSMLPAAHTANLIRQLGTSLPQIEQNYLSMDDCMTQTLLVLQLLAPMFAHHNDQSTIPSIAMDVATQVVVSREHLSESLFAVVSAVVRHFGAEGSKLTCMTLTQSLWGRVERLVPGVVLADSVEKNAVTVQCRRVLDLLTLVTMECPDGLVVPHLDTVDVLRLLCSLGNVPRLDSFSVSTVPTYQLSWHCIWVGALHVVRAVLLRTVGDSTGCGHRWRTAVSSWLVACQRVHKIIGGPKRAAAPLGVPSAAAASAFVTVIALHEMRECEMVLCILSLLVHTSPSGAHHDAVRQLLQPLNEGFMTLRKFGVIAAVLKGTQELKEVEFLAISSVKHILMTLVQFTLQEPEWMSSLETKASQRYIDPHHTPANLSAVGGGILSSSLGGSSVGGGGGMSPASWVSWSGAPLSALTSQPISLECLREFVVQQFSVIKKIQREMPTSGSFPESAGSPSHTPAPPSGYVSASLSPSLRSVDGNESVAMDSEVSIDDFGQGSLQLHVHSTAAAVTLFCAIAGSRCKSGVWIGPHRDAAERLDAYLRVVLAEVTKLMGSEDIIARTLARCRKQVEAIFVAIKRKPTSK